MKTKTLNTIGILALALSSGAAFAQNVPNSFCYQAVISAEDGSPVSNHQITVEVSIKQGNDCEDNTCPVLWQELHSPKTNDFGSFSIEIGDKNAINTTGGSLSKYSDIDWLNTTNGNYYMQVRVDFGEASYLNGMTDLGTTKFSAVPYALAAQTADYANSIATDAKGNIKNTLGQLADVTISDAKTGETKPTGLPQSDVVSFFLPEHASVIVRPSGTEPKIKAYYTTACKTMAEAEALEAKLKTDARKMLLGE